MFRSTMVPQTADRATDNFHIQLTSTNNNKNILSSEKIGRKKFFLLSGVAALGSVLLSAIPFGKSVAKHEEKHSIRIAPNPHSVKRVKGEVKNG